MPRNQKIKLNCSNCHQEYFKAPSLIAAEQKKFFCSKKCKGEYQKIHLTGANNPNFGKKWGKESREKMSSRRKEDMKDPEKRYKSGSANRGKKFSEDIRKQMSISRTGKKGTPHTKESKKLIGEKSKAKWTKEYKDKHRKMMEDSGRWIRLEDKPDKDIYYQESNWIRFLFDIVDNEKFLIYGIWDVLKNKTGLVRDHLYSRKSGFTNLVFPQILRHPVNCRLITQSENISNAQKANGKFEDLLTLEELFDRIINYEGDWFEQDKCIQLIQDYLIGLRWKKNEEKS